MRPCRWGFAWPVCPLTKAARLAREEWVLSSSSEGAWLSRGTNVLPSRAAATSSDASVETYPVTLEEGLIVLHA